MPHLWHIYWVMRTGFLLGLVVMAACSDGGGPAKCDEVSECRGDEICSSGRCVFWEQASPFADFTLTEDGPRTVEVDLITDGLPMPLVRGIRFDFGDGISGWGESVRHTYSDAGVFVVTLDVTLNNYQRLSASRVVSIDPSLLVSHNPLEIHISGVPMSLNGSSPAIFTQGTPDPSDDNSLPYSLQFASDAVELAVSLREIPSNPVVVETLSITADVRVSGRDPGAELVDLFALLDDPLLPTPTAVWSAATAPLNVGLSTFVVNVQTVDGVTHQRSVSFESVPLGDRGPLDEPISWVFDFRQDNFLIASELQGANLINLIPIAGANGRSDFEEELEAVGAQGSESALGAAEIVSGSNQGANAIYRAWVESEIIAATLNYLEIGRGVDAEVTIRSTNTPGAPPASAFSPGGPLSVMGVGGVLTAGGRGRSLYVAYGASAVNNAGPDLGLATSEILGTLVGTIEITDRFDSIKPQVGTPVGDHPEDPVVLDGFFDRFDPNNSDEANARFDALEEIAEGIGLAVGVVAAHEMGHALGLVPDGIPPDGFFGGLANIEGFGNRVSSFHGDYPGLNLMEAGSNPADLVFELLDTVTVPPQADLADIAEILARETQLSAYSRAYLRGHLTFMEPP